MAIARSLVAAAEGLTAWERFQAGRAKRASNRSNTTAVNDALASFVACISAGVRTAALQAEQAMQARRDDGMPLADDQLSAASIWELIRDSGRGSRRRAAGHSNNDVPEGFQPITDDDEQDEATGASHVYLVAIPGVPVVVDDAANAEVTTIYAIGNVSIPDDLDAYGRDHVSTCHVSLKRETQRDDGSPIVAHVDPSCIPHAVLLSACDRIRRQATQDNARIVPDSIKVWCSVGRWAGSSDAPGMAYSGYAWISYNRARELARKAKARGSKRAPLHTADVARTRNARVVAMQTTLADRTSETAHDWPIGHPIATAIAESAVDKVIRARKEARSNGKVRDVTERFI